MSASFAFFDPNILCLAVVAFICCRWKLSGFVVFAASFSDVNVEELKKEEQKIKEEPTRQNFQEAEVGPLL